MTVYYAFSLYFHFQIRNSSGSTSQNVLHINRIQMEFREYALFGWEGEMVEENVPLNANIHCIHYIFQCIEWQRIVDNDLDIEVMFIGVECKRNKDEKSGNGSDLN